MPIPDDPNDPNHGQPYDSDGVGRGVVVGLCLMAAWGYAMLCVMRWYFETMAPIRIP